MAAPSADVFLPAAGAAGAKGGKKILGLPPWGVALAVVGGLGVAYLIYRSRSSSTPAAASTPSTDSSQQPLDTGLGAGGGGAALPTPDPTAGTTTDLSGVEGLLGEILNMLQQPSNAGNVGIGGDTNVGGFGSGAPGSPSLWTYDPTTGQWHAGGTDPNNPNAFSLYSPYTVADTASPAYQQSLASLTSYWQSLGSPTTVLAAQQAAGQVPAAANSATALSGFNWGAAIAAAGGGGGSAAPSAAPPPSAIPHPSGAALSPSHPAFTGAQRISMFG